MDFPKYVWMTQNKMLYFPCLEQLASNDPFEGCYSKLNFQDRLEHKIPLPGGHNMKWNRAELSEGALEDRKNLFANCWHMNDSESDAKWRVHGANANSLAIVSSAKRLSKAIVDEREVMALKFATITHPKKQHLLGIFSFQRLVSARLFLMNVSLGSYIGRQFKMILLNATALVLK